MKNILFIISFIGVFVSCFGQTKTMYQLPFDTVRPKRYDGTGYLDAAKLKTSDTAFLQKIKLPSGTNGYVLTSDASGNMSLQPGSGGGGGTPAGNFGDLQINRNGFFDTPLLDSLNVTGTKFSSKFNNYFGPQAPSQSNAKLVLTGSDNMIALIQAGPIGSNFVTGSGEPWDAGAGWASKYYFWHTDSNVNANSNSVRLRFGTYNQRQSIMNTATNMTFTFGHGNDWILKLNATQANFNPQNSDGIAAIRNRMAWVKQTGYSGRSTLTMGQTGAAGTTGDDASNVTLSILELKGSSGSNNFYMGGSLAAYGAYLLSDNGASDTLQSYIAFHSSGGGNLVPRILKGYNFYGAGFGSPGDHIDSLWGVFMAKPTSNIIRNFFGGPVSIDPTNLHTGPVEALEVYGSIKIVDGNEQNGYVWTSDVNGKGSWQAPSSGSDSPDRINGTATNGVTANMNGYTIAFTNVLGFSVSNSIYPGGIISVGSGGRLMLGDADDDANSNRIDINDPANSIFVHLGSSGTFFGKLADSTNYNDSSYAQKAAIKQWIANATSGGGGWGLTGTVATLTGNSTVDVATHNFTFSNVGDFIINSATSFTLSGSNAIFSGNLVTAATLTTNRISNAGWYNSPIEIAPLQYIVLSPANNEEIRIVAGGQMGMHNTSPAASALLDMTSTTQGFLPPRMTATQGSAISSPAEGLIIYVTNTNGTFTAKGWWGYDGSAWVKLN